MKKTVTALVVVAAATAFLWFTTPGHRVLNTLGFAMADSCTGGNC
jgi:hypothetical protein